MNPTEELWALEYSAIAKMNGQYPYHIDLARKAGRAPYHWRVVYTGTYEKVCEKHESLAKDYKRG